MTAVDFDHNFSTDRFRIISLGYFCSVAQELGRLGLRDASFPFDWLIAPSFEKVLEMIQNGFQDFLTEDKLVQSEKYRHHYYNARTQCWFYHDFSEFQPLHPQIPGAAEKYDRRIRRFYQAISEPTIFIRYISGQEDMDYISENEAQIEQILKRYCEKNIIIYIYNDDLRTGLKNAYAVRRDSGDTVARHFLSQLPDVKEMLIAAFLNQDSIPRNRAVYRRTQNKAARYTKEIARRIRRVIERPYLHDQVMEG